MASSDEGKENRKPPSTLNGDGGRRFLGGTSGMSQNPPAGAILLMSRVLGCRLLQLSSVLKILNYASNDG